MQIQPPAMISKCCGAPLHGRGSSPEHRWCSKCSKYVWSTNNPTPEQDGQTIDAILRAFRESSIIIHAKGSIKGAEADKDAFVLSLDTAHRAIEAYCAERERLAVLKAKIDACEYAKGLSSEDLSGIVEQLESQLQKQSSSQEEND